jgi:catechol 2,3-dioxygenase-like lactoylglutathione lyase family enzyme
MMKLTAARIVTRDVPALARFYQRMTGVAPIGSDEYVEIRVTGARLAICSENAVRLFGGGAGASAANRSLILDFEVEDVDVERARLDGVVADWVLEPTTQPWGNRSTLFRDPDGNLVNLFTPAPAGVTTPRCGRSCPWRKR